MTKILTVAKTHVGQVRDHNEDTFIVGLDPISDSWLLSFDEHEIGDKGAVFVVADGMGGENAGEIAAEIAVQSIRAFIQAELKKEVVQPVNKILESALIYAHNCIKDACRDNADYIGMGTTATVCMLKDNKVYVSWIGDTRVYRYSKHGRVHALPYHFKNLEILSEDHSKVWQMMQQGQITLEEARTHEQSNIITQSLGDLFRTPQPESREYHLFKNDHILICSDGLNGMLSDEALERIFNSEIESLDKMAEQMITEANLAGGHDNITLILTKVMEGIPYNEEIIKKGVGDKTLKTEMIPKKGVKFIKEFTLAILIAILSIGIYKSKDNLFKFSPKNNEVITPTNSDTLTEHDQKSDTILNKEILKKNDSRKQGSTSLPQNRLLTDEKPKDEMLKTSSKTLDPIENGINEDIKLPDTLNQKQPTIDSTKGNGKEKEKQRLKKGN